MIKCFADVEFFFIHCLSLYKFLWRLFMISFLVSRFRFYRSCDVIHVAKRGTSSWNLFHRVLSACFFMFLFISEEDWPSHREISYDFSFKSSSTFNIHIREVLRQVWSKKLKNKCVVIPVLDAWLMNSLLMKLAQNHVILRMDKSRREIKTSRIKLYPTK